MIRLLDQSDIAALLRVKPQTVRMMRLRDQLPPPDAMTGRQPGWRPETIEAWRKERYAK